MSATLGATIHARRLELGRTQEAVGRAAGYRSGAGVSIYRVEHDQVVPSPERLTAIAAALEVDPAPLLRLAEQQRGGPVGSVARAPSLAQRRRAVVEASSGREAAIARAGGDHDALADAVLADVVAPLAALADRIDGLPAELGRDAVGGGSSERDRAAALLAVHSDTDAFVVPSFATSMLSAIHGQLEALGRLGSERVLTEIARHASASTGTPISALSGAARTSATLAKAGGGALGSSGTAFGMAGGRVALGAVAAAPMIAGVVGVIATSLVASRRESARLVSEAEERLAATEGRFQMLIEHLGDAASLLDLVNTHGTWALASWLEGVDPDSQELRIAWSDLDEGRRASLRRLWRLASAIARVLALPSEALVEAGDDAAASVATAFADVRRAARGEIMIALGRHWS